MSNKLEEELKALRQEITDNRKAAMERRQRSSEIREEIKELEEKLLLRKAEQGSNNSKQWALEKSVKAGEIRETELVSEIKEEKFKADVEEMFSKQPTFFERLEKTYSMKMEENFDGLQDFGSYIDTSEFIKKMRHLDQTVAINKATHALRTAKLGYEERIRSLCEQKMKGQRIPSQQLQTGARLLESFIFNPDIESLWSVQ